MIDLRKNKTEKEVWEIVLLTPQGLKTEYLTPSEKSIDDFEKEMVKKYRTFTTYSSNLI